MRRRLALLDWDGTLRAGYTLMDWTRHLADCGLIDGRDATEVRATLAQLRSDTAEHDRVIERAAALYASAVAGVRTDQVQCAATRFVAGDKPTLYPFVVPLLRWLEIRRIEPIVISGAPEMILRRHADRLGISEAFGLTVRSVSGRFAGMVGANPGTSAMKRKYLESLVRHSGDEIAVALGDSASDVPMLENAGLAIVIDNPVLADLVGAASVSSESFDVDDVLSELA